MNYFEQWMPTNPLYHTLTKIIIVFIIVMIINLILRLIIGHLSKKTEIGQACVRECAERESERMAN